MIHKLQQGRKKVNTRRLKNSECIQAAMSLGCTEAKIIPTESIITGHWVKLKCQYGCPSFACVLTCPPYAPSIEDVWDLFAEYHLALLIRGKDGEFIRDTVPELERKFVQSGFHKAFGMGAGPCKFCSPCQMEQGCKFPEKARPSITACGVDVFKTVQNQGWEISPTSPDSPNEHFGLILID